MLKNQTVNHVSEHLSAICPVYTVGGGSVSKANGGEGSTTAGLKAPPYGLGSSPLSFSQHVSVRRGFISLRNIYP